MNDFFKGLTGGFDELLCMSNYLWKVKDRWIWALKKFSCLRCEKCYIWKCTLLTNGHVKIHCLLICGVKYTSQWVLLLSKFEIYRAYFRWRNWSNLTICFIYGWRTWLGSIETLSVSVVNPRESEGLPTVSVLQEESSGQSTLHCPGSQAEFYCYALN